MSRNFAGLAKRLLIVCLCLVMALGTTVSIMATGFDGDVDGDGRITAFDAQLIAEYEAGNRKLEPAQVIGLTVQNILDRVFGKTEGPVIENITVEKGLEVKVDETGAVAEEVTINEDKVSVAMPTGVLVTGEALTLSVQTVEPGDSQANVKLQENELVTSLDVHLEGVDTANTVPMLITLENYLPVGLNSGSLKLYHVENGQTLEMIQVDVPVNHNEFSYDPMTGTVVLAMASFSEVAVVADAANTWDGKSASGFAGGSGTEEDPWLIANASQLAYFRDQVDAGNTYEGEFIKLTNTIELSNVNFDPIGYGYDYDGYMPDGKTFNGTFDGDHHTIKDLYQNGWELGDAYSYSMAGGGLFASAVDATFKNVHISGANIVMECVDMGILVGYSQGNCTYDHIRIYNSKIANYQRATGGVIGEVSPKRGADGQPVSETNVHYIKDVVIGNNVVVGSLWGDFDAPVGGVVGARWDDDNATQVVMEDVTVGCRLDVYCDVTSSYRWHAYRRAGMLIGNTDTPTADGRTAKTATADFLTCKNVVVELGNWTDYQYCQFVNEYNTAGNSWPWVRVQAGENCSAYSNPRYGHPKDADGNVVTNDIHTHNEGEGCRVLMPFAQLYGGGQGVYGATSHPGVVVTRPIYTIAYMNGTEVQEVIYVNDNSVPYTLKDAGTHMSWLDREGNKVTQIPAGNTKNIVLHLDDDDKLIAHFRDINGMEIAAVEFVKGQKTLQEPAVPAIDGYSGHWEYYDLANATTSIVIKPVYTVEDEYKELAVEMDINKLFQWLSEGRTIVMTQQLEGGQGNASKDYCSEIVTGSDTDKDARLNLNGYTLEYEFSSNGNKNWHIFDIKGGSSLTISGGITNEGILHMHLESLNKNAKARVFELEPGATLILEKGTIIDLYYPSGRASDVSMFYVNDHSWKPTPEEYPNLQFTDNGSVKRLVALETTVITVPAN